MDIKRGPVEVALSTDLRGAPYAFSLWDIHTGAQLVVFKGTNASPVPDCLKLIDSHYFITATDNLLQIWSIYNRKCQDQKLFLPGRPSSLCVSTCGKYLIVGISEMIYVWQLSSGNLLAHNQRHYQTVKVLRTNHKGTFLFSGGEDGLVLVWPFSELLSGSEPRFTWQHHSSSITDIHVTSSDCALCITTSLDKTVNIYSYAEGKRLHCISDLPTPIWSVTMDRNCNRMFLGGQDGNIYEVSISSLSELLRVPNKSTFTGHKDRVDKLLLSIDGSLLISGSHDSTCKIWDIPTAKMVRDVKHQAPVANLVSLVVPDAFSLTSITQSNKKPPYLVRPLKRTVNKLTRNICVTTEDLFEESSTTIVMRKSGKRAPVMQMVHTMVATSDQQSQDDKKSTIDDKKMKTKLRELYLLSAEKLFKDAAGDCLKRIKL